MFSWKGIGYTGHEDSMVHILNYRQAHAILLAIKVMKTWSFTARQTD